uniref:SEA domain-containing protein n=1 Tax=Setaria digitata TaxID=48799 RepID=A0A915Q1E0_9BILA
MTFLSNISAITQSVESGNDTERATSLPSLPQSSLLPVQLKSSFESETNRPSFDKSLLPSETVMLRERTFPFPEIKRARELGAADLTNPEQKFPLLTLPFTTETDRGATATITSEIDEEFEYPDQQNSTQPKTDKDEVKEISTLEGIEVPQVDLMLKSTRRTDDKTDESMDDTLPPEVRAADPFATTVTEDLTLFTSQENITNIIQNNFDSKLNSPGANNFGNNSDDANTSKAIEVGQTDALEKDFVTVDVGIVFTTSSSSSPEFEHETIMIGTSDGTTTVPEISSFRQEMTEEIKVAVPEEQGKNTALYSADVFGTPTMEPVPNVFVATTGDTSLLAEQTTATESIPTVELVPTVTLLEVHSPSHHVSADVFSTEPSTTPFVEMKQESEMSKFSTTLAKLLPTTTAFNFAETLENEQEQVHEDENLFVGDKALFNQAEFMKASQDSSTISAFSTTTENSEENFGVPGFSRIERPGPEATEEISQAEADAAAHSPSAQSSNIGPEVQTGIPVGITGDHKNLDEHQNGKQTSIEELHTTGNSFEESSELKDISVVDDTFHVQTGIKAADQTLSPVTDERKSELGPTVQPEPPREPVPEISGLGTPEANLEPNVSGSEPESATESNGPRSNEDDSNGILHTHHTHVTDSRDAKEGTYKTPFSFRITSIDYIPEFSDLNSGKYKKLRDQLLPDLEEIFGSIFGHIYEGTHLVSFLKGSVVVDGIVYTSAKPDDMEQLATEFEQQITAKNLQIGGNDVDARSIALDGYVSKNYVERIHEGYTSGSTSSYIVGGGIAIGILAILLIAFTVIAMNNRRTNGTMKLKEENIAMAEDSRSMWQSATAPVNLCVLCLCESVLDSIGGCRNVTNINVLAIISDDVRFNWARMGYGNGRTIQGGTTTNTQPPMVMIGSQMTAVNTHAAARAMQPRP